MDTGGELIEATGLLKSLGLALGLGLLVGLQREWTHDRVGGIRTFPLVALFGGLCALLSQLFGGWIAAAGLLGCAAMVILANVASWRSGEKGVGLTTEISMLVMFVIGMVVVMGYWLEGTVCAATMMVLLQWKKPMHAVVRKIGEGELTEIARLVLAGLVILPLLPNRDMGYLDVINPFKIWLLVVLIIGISLVAYLASKFLGGRKGALVSGLLGGLISSTATTASAARRSKSSPRGSRAFALITMVASAVVFGRVMVEVTLAGGDAGRRMLAPLAVMLVWMVAIAFAMWRWGGAGSVEAADDNPPSELKGAVVFALLYVAVLTGVAFAREKLGDSALYGVAALSGLTDMDAITLSTSRLVSDGHIDTGTGWRLILLGGVANLVFKAGMVAVIGSRAMLKPVLVVFGISIAGAAVLWAAWPG